MPTVLSYAEDGSRIKHRADFVLTLMSYSFFPDVIASDLNIGGVGGETNELSMTQFGGGATYVQGSEYHAGILFLNRAGFRGRVKFNGLPGCTRN